jgi:peroxiredoxin
VRGELPELHPLRNNTFLSAGTKAPDLKMVGLASGETERLSDFSGRAVVLEFWKSGSGVCQAAMTAFQSFATNSSRWEGKVICLAANIDARTDAAADQVKTNDWNRTHNVWVGPDAIKKYQLKSIPTMYVIDKRGNLVAGQNAGAAEPLIP